MTTRSVRSRTEGGRAEGFRNRLTAMLANLASRCLCFGVCGASMVN